MKRIAAILLAAMLVLSAGSALAKESLMLGVDTQTIVLGETLTVSYEAGGMPADAKVIVGITLMSGTGEGSTAIRDYEESFTDAAKTITYTLTDPTATQIRITAGLFRESTGKTDIEREINVTVEGGTAVPAFDVVFSTPASVTAERQYSWTVTLEGAVAADLDAEYRVMEVTSEGEYYPIGDPTIVGTVTIGSTYTASRIAPDGNRKIQIWLYLTGAEGAWTRCFYSSDIQVAEAGTAGKDEAKAKVEAFVGRCYNLIMNREAEAGGLAYWSGLLTDKKATASEIIDQFSRSEEFVNRKLSSAEKVEMLYNTMLNRKAEAEGKAFWVDRLENGGSEAQLINDFCGSEEFTAICGEYGIEPGSVQAGTGNASGGTGIEGFVRRCYTVTLNRDADQAGVEFWVSRMTGGMDPRAVADNFVFSEELENQGLDDDGFIRTLYRLYMGREADEGGLAYWNGRMANGATRQDVNDGFAGSEEFAGIVAGFGL